MPDRPELPSPTQVIVNGAAVTMMTALVDQLRQDMYRRFDDHDERHDREETGRLEARVRTNERINDLEKWQRGELDAELLAKGRWQVFRVSAKFLSAYGWRIASILALVVAAIVGLAGGVDITFGRGA